MPPTPAATAAGSGFALTKIQPPRQRARLIVRPRLEQRLADALAQVPLVLVCAPAGFGKTAAITRQVGQLPPGTALAWIAADEDDDLGRFAACLVAALEPFDLPWRTSPDALVAAQDGQRAARQALASELLNALAATDVPRGLLVIDDAHRITDPAVFELLDALLERLPPQWRVLIASRVDPPLALAKLRVRGDLAEFRQADLAFSGDEVRALLQARQAAEPRTEAPANPPADARAATGDAPPADQQAQALFERTQGWPAGLNLALAHAGRASATPAGSLRDRHVFDYLTAEVLDDLAPPLRDFLLRCAVMPVLTARRCAAVTGQADAARLLDEVERRGLFVSVRADDAGGTAGEAALCLHDLFRDCLEATLRRERPDEWPQLLRRAADTEPDLVRRVGYLVRAADWPAAEAVLCQQGPGLLAQGGVVTVLRLIEQLPDTLRAQSPPLAHLRGVCAWAHWDLLTMCQQLERAATGYRRLGQHAAAQRAQALMVLGLSAGGQVPRGVALLATLRQQPMDATTETTAWQASCWHALADSRLDAIAAPLGRMMDLLERSDDLALWLQAVPLTSFVGLPGTRAPLQRYIDGVLRRTADEPPTTLRLLALSLQAGLWLWAGRVADAAELLARIEPDLRWLNRPPNLNGYVNVFAGLVHAVRGRRDAAMAAAQARLDGLDDQRTSGRRETWLSHFLYTDLRLAMLLDDAATVRDRAARLAERQHPDEVPFFVRERAPLAGHLAALDGRWDAAAEAYAAALADEMGTDLYGQAMEVRLRAAHAELMRGRVADAAALARLACDRATASGEPGPALLAGPRVLAALAAAPWGPHLPPEAQHLLAGWARQLAALQPAAAVAAAPASPGASPGATIAPPAGLPASLSSREREVLARIAAGDSNKLIARAFDLSPHTVKRHVANILDKLGLASRGQAAAWYRAQRLD